MAIWFGEDNEVNRKRLETWIVDFTRQFSNDDERWQVEVEILYRMAMRFSFAVIDIFPIFADEDWARPLTLTSLRCLITSGLAGNWPSTNDMINASEFAANSAALSSLLYAQSASEPAISSLASSAYSAAFSAANSSFSVFSSRSTDYNWESVRRDIVFLEHDGDAGGLLAQPLFINEGYDQELKWSVDDDAALKALKQNYPEYDFWVRWIQSVYNGRGMYGATRSNAEWEMLKKIGLIENDVWELGAKAVAEEIGDIEDDFKVMHEERELNPEDEFKKLDKKTKDNIQKELRRLL